MRKLPFAFAGLVIVGIFAACGSESEDGLIPGPDGGDANALGDTNASGSSTSGSIGDGSTNDGSSSSSSSSGSSGSPDSGPVVPGDTCHLAGADCTGPTECCTGACVAGKCSATQCVPDKPTAGNCTENGQCCSGVCGSGGKCESLNGGGACRTAGNPCNAHGDCCSKLCNGGFCSSTVSFCTQQSDVCSTNTECCSGNCVKQGTNITGLCGAPPTGGGIPSGCEVAGTVCGGSAGAATDAGGLAPCDQNCCSRSCGYFGATSGFRVCQPPSGCHPTGELCRAGSDCCGWKPDGSDVDCAKKSPTDEFGRCDNGNACREPGSICKPGTSDSCSAENSCCEPIGSTGSSFCNTPDAKCCKKDALGIPRCLLKAVDCAAGAPPVGSVCATSADCCGNPCIGGQCLGVGACQPAGSTCTNTADCCKGIPCIQAPGSATGICGGTLLPDGGVVQDAGSGSSSSSSSSGGSSSSSSGGTTCALYGQLCSVAGDCCDGVPCTVGRCRLP